MGGTKLQSSYSSERYKKVADCKEQQALLTPASPSFIFALHYARIGFFFLEAYLIFNHFCSQQFNLPTLNTFEKTQTVR